MKNEIVHRVYTFLKDYPPFSFLSRAELLLLSEKVWVKYLPKSTVLFQIGEATGEYFYIVHKGALHLYRADESLADSCDEGDVVGIRPFLAKSAYLLKAMATEETIVYGIPAHLFLLHMENNVRVAKYMASHFASGVQNYAPSTDSNHAHFTEIFTIHHHTAVVHCQANTTIREAAIEMTRKAVGSILICDDQMFPLGIVTDKDLRSRVVAGTIGANEAVSQIMSSPVHCVPPGMSAAALQMEMVKKNINHLVVTEGGVQLAPVLGIISEHDLLVQQGNNPTVLIRQIRSASSVTQLRLLRDRMETLTQRYLEQDVSIAFITEVISRLNDEIIQRCILLALLEAEDLSAISFCWLSLGSEGREEQLLRTDQDNALVFTSALPVDAAKKLLLPFAQKVNEFLAHVGFEYCPANMMAGNAMWCLSLEEWKAVFSKWIHQPGEKEIMMSTIFFDYRSVYGNKELAAELTDHIFHLLDRQDLFLHLLAKNALENPPPLSFFRNFVVEKNGEHKNDFDLKLRAMMPLADAARLLILSKRLGGENNTVKRYLKMAETEPENASLYQMAADAYEVLLRIRASSGLKHKDSGRYIQPEALDKMVKLHLRNSFISIDELHQLIMVRFQLGGRI